MSQDRFLSSFFKDNHESDKISPMLCYSIKPSNFFDSVQDMPSDRLRVRGKSNDGIDLDVVIMKYRGGMVFICPVCKKRVYTLYMPLFSRSFACYKCNNVSIPQRTDKFTRLIRSFYSIQKRREELSLDGFGSAITPKTDNKLRSISTNLLKLLEDAKATEFSDS